MSSCPKAETGAICLALSQFDQVHSACGFSLTTKHLKEPPTLRPCWPPILPLNTKLTQKHHCKANITITQTVAWSRILEGGSIADSNGVWNLISFAISDKNKTTWNISNISTCLFYIRFDMMRNESYNLFFLFEPPHNWSLGLWLVVLSARWDQENGFCIGLQETVCNFTIHSVQLHNT